MLICISLSRTLYPLSSEAKANQISTGDGYKFVGGAREVANVAMELKRCSPTYYFVQMVTKKVRGAGLGRYGDQRIDL